MDKSLRLLVVEDSEDDALLVIDVLGRGGYKAAGKRVETGEDMASALKNEAWDLVISDWTLPRFSGLEALKTLKGSGMDLPFILVSGRIGETTAVEMMRAGAHDYVMKGHLERLAAVVERELREAGERRKRREAEAALRRSEESFRQLSEAAMEAIAIHDKGQIVLANASFIRMFGYPLSEVIAKNALELAAPESRALVMEKIRTGDTRPYEAVGLKKDGSIFTCELCGSSIFYGGRWLRATAIRDITERKQAEEALKRSEERYRTVVAASPDGVAVMGTDGLINFVSQKLLDLFGYQDESEITGRSPVQWIAPDDRERARANIGAILKGGFTGPNQYRLLRKDGTSFWGEINSSPMRDSQGNPGGMIAIIRDVTSRKEAQNRLEAQKKLTDGILASTPNDVLVVDRDRRIVLANRAVQRDFRIEEAEGRALADVVGAGGLARGLTEAISGVLATGRPQLDVEIRDKVDAADRIVVAQILPLNEEGHEDGPERVLVIFRDVTLMRAAQQQLYHTAALTTIGELTSGVAHELNNPLTSLVGFSEILSTRKDLPADAREILGTVNREARRMAEILRNLLIFARKHPAEKAPVDINEVIVRVLKLRAYEQRLSNIEVTSHLDAGLPPVTANASQLQQVFLNIIVNAEYFMKEAHGRGALVITTERAGDAVRATVADDGPGIPEENIGRLFTPFFTTKPAGKGTGLGLGISHGIITEHGGRIYAQSERGKGATFIVELPIEQGEAL